MEVKDIATNKDVELFVDELIEQLKTIDVKKCPKIVFLSRGLLSVKNTLDKTNTESKLTPDKVKDMTAEYKADMKRQGKIADISKLRHVKIN